MLSLERIVVYKVGSTCYNQYSSWQGMRGYLPSVTHANAQEHTLNSQLDKQVNAVYSELKVGCKPEFAFIELVVDPSHVDVNSDPTKNQVQILDQDCIAVSLNRALKHSLHDISFPQSLQSSSTSRMAKSKRTQQISLPEHQTIKHYFRPVPVDTSVAETQSSNTNASTTSDVQAPAQSRTVLDSLLHPAPLATYKIDNSALFSSICTSKHYVYSEEEPKTSVLLQNSTDVGSVDAMIRLIVYNNKYYLIQASMISEQVIYQCILNRIGRFDTLRLDPSISLQQCLSLEYPEDRAHAMALDLYSKRDILVEHFKTDLVLENGTIWLKSLPLIISNYAPTMYKLPLFICRLYTKIKWESEEKWFESLAHEYAMLYNCTTQQQWIALKKQIIEPGSFKAPHFLTLQGFIIELEIPFIVKDDI